MSPDRITDCLRRADDIAGPPPALPADLASRVGRRIRRRRAVRRSAAVAGPLLAAGLAVTAWVYMDHQRLGPPLPPARIASGATPAEIARMRAEEDRLRVEADQEMRLVTYMENDERLDREVKLLKAMQAQPDPVERLETQVERAALLTLKDADALAHDPAQRQAAIEGYRRVIALYPRTTWAGVARQRLGVAG